MHQTVIGQEAMAQMEMAGDYPGRHHRLHRRRLATSPASPSRFSARSCAAARKVAHHRRRTGGLPQPDARHVRLRLRRHGASDAAGQDAHARARPSCRRASTPAACATTAWRRWSATCKELGLIEATAYQQIACFEAGVQFARAEGIIPAPEANHAVSGAIDEALKCKRGRQVRTILFNLSGHGHFDMQAYIDYFAASCRT